MKNEYAYGAAKGKNNIYITFAFNITKNCDCHGHSIKDMGILRLQILLL